MEQLQNKSLTKEQQAYNYIFNKIVSGKWEQGRLISASDIACELGMSRSPIRIAISRLEGQKLIKKQSNVTIVWRENTA